MRQDIQLAISAGAIPPAAPVSAGDATIGLAARGIPHGVRPTITEAR